MKPSVNYKTLRVLCIDDHELVRKGLNARFAQESDMEFVATLPDAQELLPHMKNVNPDVVLIDLEMPGPDPFETISDIKRMFPNVRIIVLSAHIRDHYVDAAVNAGAWGYFSKNDDVDELIGAIRKTSKEQFALGSKVRERCQLAESNGRKKTEGAPVSRLDSLTPREQQVLRMIGRGLGRKEIATELHRSPRTIDNHRASIMRKLDITDRVELVRFAIREGLVEI